MVLGDQGGKWHCLILILFLISCSGRTEKTNGIAILWENERATGLSIPQEYLALSSIDSIKSLTIHLVKDGDTPAILGDYEVQNGGVLFRPLIPFTRGLTYEVIMAGRSIVKIEIPVADKSNAPVLTAIYPTQDTLPQNLLKIYLRFSRPMREGQSLKHLYLLQHGTDTIPEVFLDLQPELWNSDRTLLTVWLDPGRIKRDLQPNRRLGVPLVSGTAYRLVVSSEWQDTRGLSLQQDFLKDFFCTSRDSLSPDPAHWTIAVAKAESTDPVVINFHETLDCVLLQDAIHVTDTNGSFVSGTLELDEEETIFLFTPESAWSKGEYLVQFEARLEDLAGNNLNRPFDRDLKDSRARASKDVYSRKFQIN